LGLFTGMSIVSIAELLFWLLRLFTGWSPKPSEAAAAEQATPTPKKKVVSPWIQ